MKGRGQLCFLREAIPRLKPDFRIKSNGKKGLEIMWEGQEVQGTHKEAEQKVKSGPTDRVGGTRGMR